MKKNLLILSIFLFTGFSAMAQEEDNDKSNEMIRQKMTEFIQRRLKLSKAESEKFSPVFIRYFKEWRQTLRENRADILKRRQKVAELQIRYRNEFREILGEKRSNQVYRQQEVFIEELKTANDRIKQRETRPNKNLRSVVQ